MQCFRSGSDPYPDSGSGSRRTKITHKNRKIFEISCFEELDVLFCGLKASSVAWTSFMEAQGKVNCSLMQTIEKNFQL
jgi:hypothetical protein